MSSLAHLLRREWLAVRVQIALGAVFIAAAWPKLSDPPSFAKNIWAYDILPGWTINLQAMIMPGVEMVIGVALILGLWRRGAAIVALFLLLIFGIAVSWALVSGNPVHCGCFDVHAAARSDAQLFWDLKMVLLRDVGLLVMTAHLLWYDPPRRFRGR
jgi:uncharacterized membrane protein YphA (DoxX/SURF4 family)